MIRKIKKINKIFLIFNNKYSSTQIKKFQNNFLNATNLIYIQSLYQKWKIDKNSVSHSFSAFFYQLEEGTDPEVAYTTPPKPGQAIKFIPNQSPFVSQQLKLRMMIQRYRSISHQLAKVDPLKLSRSNFVGAVEHNQFGLDYFQFTPQQLDYQYRLKSSRAPDAEIKNYSVQDMKNALQGIYCQSVGYQYTHLLDKDERDFITLQLQSNIQSLKVTQPSKQQKIKAFNRICKDQSFIDFLGHKFANFKRFGVQGLNSAACALQQLVQQSAKLGTKNIMFGMAHRGRLNTLHCIFGKPAQIIFKQFLQKSSQQSDLQSGDVKYHLGYNTVKKYDGKQITLTMLPNPSHLQAVNPLLYGSVRAIMQATNDPLGKQVLGVLIHGDAAISGQGIVYQSLQFQDLKQYTPRGIIHIVMNNQIGFTTNPSQDRSSYYCTQIAKVIGAPVFHVNANQPAILDRCIRIALEYRFKFKKDIFIDIVGYRRYGHNQQDQPFFTQPKMYEIIKQTPTLYQYYTKQMIEKNVLTKQQIQQKKNSFLKIYQQQYQKVINQKYDKFEQTNHWLRNIKPINSNIIGTGISKNILKQLFNIIHTWPQNFNIHPIIKKIYQERIHNFNHDQPLDWATMECLAFATLLKQGYGVRLSGQDVQRGTFSHRHAFISDQKNDVPKHCFLKNVSPKVYIKNSHLSEYGVLGFEFGYSLMDPNFLTVWQAQFGDFANGAAIIIDNYIVNAQSKWKYQTGLVLNLPHGMDGQGPQHSSARMQRFLQMSDDNCDVNQKITYDQQMKNCNIQIVSCSTSSNYFHAMRRQLIRNYRKPLVMFNSKKLLKFKPANRPITDILQNTSFIPVYADELNTPPSSIKKVLICNGQFYYDLKQQRQQRNRKDIAIIRIEQIAPFPIQQLKKIISTYGNKVQYGWVQQQHQNYGAWNFIYPRLKILLNKPIQYYGRHASASPANGKLKCHKMEEEALFKQIFT